VTTQDPLLQHGLDPDFQSLRLARFVQSFRNEVLAVTHAAGYEHPSQFTADDIEMSSGPAMFTTLRELHGYTPDRTWKGIDGWGKTAGARAAPPKVVAR
jgi:glutamate synthase (ferredoxin)